MAGRAVRDPFPFGALIDGNGVMLLEPKDGSGPMVGTRPQTLDQVAPPEFLDDAQNPLFARPQVYTDLSLGMGRKLQQDPKDRFYYYAINADLSQSHKWLKGPVITQTTPLTTDATNGVQDFFEIGGNLYMLVGRYVLKRAADNNLNTTGGKDFGAGKAGLTARMFTSAFAGTKLIFISMGSATPDKDYYFDGTTFTQMASFQSLDYISVGSDFYRASGINLVSKVNANADPTNEANWTSANQFHVGDQTSPIVRFGISATGVLLVFKTDGMYSLDQNGQDIRYYPFLQFNKDPNGDSCKNVGYYENDVYVQWNGGFYRVKADFTLEHCGPELEVTNDSPVRGYITASMGYQSLNLYAGLWNPDTSTAYLMKFGSWESGHFSAFTGRTIEEAIGSRIDSWHGSISSAFTAKITTIWQSAVGAPTGHNRCWLGFADGSYAYFILPCTPDPSACTQYLFSTTNGQVFLPLFTATWLGDPKSLRKFVVMCPNLSATNYLQLKYKADSTAASYTDLGTNFTMAPRSQVNFPNNTAGSLSDLQVVMVSTSTASCPQPVGCVLYHAVRPEFLLEYDFTVLAMDGLLDRTGRPIRAQAAEIAGWLTSACSVFGSVTTVLPDEASKQLSYKDYTEATGYDDRTQQWGKTVQLKAYEFITNTTYGTNDRARVYTNDGVANYTNTQMTLL